MQEEFISGNPQRAQRGSKRHNTLPSEEMVTSGPLQYRYLWDWAKIPARLEKAAFLGVAWSPQGFLYAATDHPRCAVAVFDQDGSYVRGFGTSRQLGAAHGVSVDRRGNVWVTSTDRHVALQYDAGGNMLRSLGSYDVPSDSGINDECADSRWRWHTIRRMAGPFNRPTRLVEGPSGDLFAADGYGNAAIHRFDSHGALRQTWGGMGREPGRLTVPHSLWVDDANRVLVADSEADRIQIFTDAGELAGSLEDLLYPMDVVSDGRYIYAAEREGRISIFSRELALVAQLGCYGGPYAAHGIAVDPRGDLYFSSLRRGFGLCKLVRVEPEAGGGVV